MEILQSFITFLNNIMNIEIFDNITTFDIVIYMLLIWAVIKFIKTATKGGNK